MAEDLRLYQGVVVTKLKDKPIARKLTQLVEGIHQNIYLQRLTRGEAQDGIKVFVKKNKETYGGLGVSVSNVDVIELFRKKEDKFPKGRYV